MKSAALVGVLLFEVMDKEWPLWLVAVVFLGLAFAGFLLCRWRRQAAFFILPVIAFYAWGQIAEIRDPYVGPAILKEAGPSYVILSYSFIALATILPLFGLAINQWRRVRG